VPRKREFDPKALDAIRIEAVCLSYESGRGIQGDALQFNVFLPRRVLLGSKKQSVCSARDELLLGRMLVKHFGGYSFKVDLLAGFGLREGETETNLHRVFTVVAASSDDTTQYFRILRKELQE
jgi:hypothetical protein